MEVEVKLFATLRDGRFNKGKVDLSQNSKISDLLEKLDIPRTVAAILLVNGQEASTDRERAENDVVSIFPPIAGG